MTFPKIGKSHLVFVIREVFFRNREKGLAKRMPDQNDADSVCYNLFAHYSVYRVTRDAVPARVPSPFNQHPNRWSWTCWNWSGTGPVDMGRMLTFKRELRRLKDNSLKIPNLKYIFKIALLRGDPHPDTLFWHSFWHIIWTYMWHICSDILSYILFWDSIWHSFWHPIWHLFWHTFWNILYSDPALPWVWAGSAFICADQCQWLEYPPNVGFTCLHPMIAITLIPQNGQVLNLRVGPEKFSGYWKNRTLAHGSEKEVRRWKIQVCCWVAKLG